MDRQSTAHLLLSTIDRGLGRAIGAIDRVAEIVASTALVVVVLINALEIMSRTLLNDSQTWVYEINLLLANWIYFIGIVLVYYKKQDIVIDILFDFLGSRVQRFYLIFLNIVLMGVLAVLVFYGWRLVGVQSRTATLDLHIPNHLFSLPVVIGAIAMFLIVLGQSTTLALGGESKDAPER